MLRLHIESVVCNEMSREDVQTSTYAESVAGQISRNGRIGDMEEHLRVMSRCLPLSFYFYLQLTVV